MLDDVYYFTVTDLKQYAYCPRVVFYERCLPHVRPRTFKMDAGRDIHEDEEDRAARRTLRQYGEVEGERRFGLHLTSLHLGLTGELDEVVYTADGRCFPVDYKFAKGVSHHYKIQLTAYAMLLEEAESREVEYGFVYLILSRKMVKVNFSVELRKSVLTILAELQRMIEQERMPQPAENPHYCTACEFRRFCNDV